jgi:tripartite-type tricarboxylate transporter receptor subunit TctC
MRRRTLLQAAALSPVATPAIGQARGWPNKPVKVIIPFAAGGGTDVLGRPWCDKLSTIFGQQFVVENRGGASGLIGTEAAARSPNDGYTFLISASTTTVNLPLMRSVPYDPKSLEPIARLGDALTGFAMHPGPGPKTFPEMVAYARANPGKLAFGSSGPGTGPHLRLEMLKFRTGLDILHVPYRGGADSLVDLLAGHVQLMNEPVTTPHIKAGKLHLLNVNHFERAAEFPDTPTLTELGLPDSDVPIWVSLWCPTGVPQEIKQRLNTEIVAIMKTQEMRDKLRMIGSVPVTQTIAEMKAFREADGQRMAALIKGANIKIE